MTYTDSVKKDGIKRDFITWCKIFKEQPKINPSLVKDTKQYTNGKEISSK